jgi:hypothetical protein
LYRFVDFARLRRRNLLAGAGSGVVVDDQDLVDEAGGREVLNGTSDGIPLVVGGQDERDDLTFPDG